MLDSIPTRPLGSTGIAVPILGFGAATLGGSYGPIALSEAERAVHTALDAGMNFFDTSPYYGRTESERALGHCLRGVPRNRYIMATKVGRYGDQEFDFTAARVTASVDESLARLGTDHLDLLQCHDIEFWPLQRIIDETLPALQCLKQSGKVRAIGITDYPLKIFRTVLAQAKVDCILSYCHHTLLDDTLVGEAPWLQQQGVGILNASPLAMGALSTKGPPLWHPAPVDMKVACRTAAALCLELGSDLGRLALQYSLTMPGVASTFVGIGSVAELQMNLASFDQPIDTDLLRRVRAVLAPWSKHVWVSGLAENN
ncbi:MAG TPA: aldo/keto reductase [Planctomycetota bacterium]|nr:aldo/keto reductase [Planctomycetota bacterium]